MLSLPKPNPTQLTFQDYEIGLLYSLDLTIYRTDGSDHSRGEAPLDIDLFNPVALDTDQWLEAAQAAGAKYAIFTASHQRQNNCRMEDPLRRHLYWAQAHPKNISR